MIVIPELIVFFLTNCFPRGFPPWASPLKIYCVLVKTSSQICLVEIASFIPAKKGDRPDTQKCMKFHDNYMNILNVCNTFEQKVGQLFVFAGSTRTPDAVLPAGTMSTPAGNCNACCDARQTIARCKSDMKRCWRQGTPGVVIRFSRWYLPPNRLVLLRMDLRLHCMSMYIIICTHVQLLNMQGVCCPLRSNLEMPRCLPTTIPRPRTHYIALNKNGIII